MERLASRHNRSEINANRERIRTPSVEDDRVFPSVLKVQQPGSQLYSNRSVSGHNSCNLQYYFRKNLAMLSQNIEETNPTTKLLSAEQSSNGTNQDEVSPNDRRWGAGNNKTSMSCQFSKRAIQRKGGINYQGLQTESEEIIEISRIPPRERQSFEATTSSSSVSAMSIEARRNFEQLKSLNQFSASKNKFKTPKSNNTNNSTKGEETKYHQQQQSQQEMLILPVKMMTTRLLSAKSIKPRGQLHIPFLLKDIDNEKEDKEKTFTPISVERQTHYERLSIPKSISESKSSARLGFAKQDQLNYQGKVNEEIYETPQFPESTATSTDIKVVSAESSLPAMKFKCRNSNSHSTGGTKSFPKTISSRVLSNIQCSMQLRKILHSNEQSDSSNNVFVPLSHQNQQQQQQSNQQIQNQSEQQNQQYFNRLSTISYEKISKQNTKRSLEQWRQHEETIKSTQLLPQQQQQLSPPPLSQQQILKFLKPLTNVASFSKDLVLQSQELLSARNYDNTHDHSQQQQRLFYKKQRNLSAGGPSSSSTTKKRLLIKTINPFKKIENISTQQQQLQQCSQLSECKQIPSSVSKTNSSNSAQKERLQQEWIKFQDPQQFFMEFEKQQQMEKEQEHNQPQNYQQQSNQQISQFPFNSKILSKTVNHLEPTHQQSLINPQLDLYKICSNQNRVQSAVDYKDRLSINSNQQPNISNSDQNNANRLSFQIKQTLSATRKRTENQSKDNFGKIRRSTSATAKQIGGKVENARSTNPEKSQECRKQQEENKYYSAPLQLDHCEGTSQWSKLPKQEVLSSQEIRLFYSKRNKENQDTPESVGNQANTQTDARRVRKHSRITQSSEKMHKKASTSSSSQLIPNQYISLLPTQGIGNNSTAELAQDLYDLRLSVQIENIDHHFACLNQNLLNQQLTNRDNNGTHQRYECSDDEIPSRFLDQIDSFQQEEPQKAQINELVAISNPQSVFEQEHKDYGSRVKLMQFELPEDCNFPSKNELETKQRQNLFEQQSVQQWEKMKAQNLRSSSSQQTSEIFIHQPDQFSQIFKPNSNQQSFLSDHLLFESINQSLVLEDGCENLNFDSKNQSTLHCTKRTNVKEITNRRDNGASVDAAIIQTSSSVSSNKPKNKKLIPGELSTKQDDVGVIRISSPQLQQRIQQLKASSPVSQLNQLHSNQSQQLYHGFPLPKPVRHVPQPKTSPFRTTFDGQNFIKPLQQQQQNQQKEIQRSSLNQEQAAELFPRANSRQMSSKKLRKSDSGSIIFNGKKEIKIA